MGLEQFSTVRKPWLKLGRNFVGHETVEINANITNDKIKIKIKIK